MAVSGVAAFGAYTAAVGSRSRLDIDLGEKKGGMRARRARAVVMKSSHNANCGWD